MGQSTILPNDEAALNEEDIDAVRLVKPLQSSDLEGVSEHDIQDIKKEAKEARKSLIGFLFVILYFEYYWGVGSGSCMVCWALVFVGTFFWTAPEENGPETELLQGHVNLAPDNINIQLPELGQYGGLVEENILRNSSGEKIDSHSQVVWTTMGNFLMPYLLSLFIYGIIFDVSENIFNQGSDMSMVFAAITSGIAFFAYLLHRYSIVLSSEKLRGCFSFNKLTFALILPTLMIMIIDFVCSIPLAILAENLFPSDMEQIPISDDSSLSSPFFLALLFISIVIIAPITEELAYRGLLLDFLKEKYGDWPAIIVSSLLFGIVHVIPSAIAVATFGGLIYGWLRIKTDSLWPGIFCHAIWNVFAFSMFLLSH